MSSLTFNLSTATGGPAEASITLTELSNGDIQVQVDLISGTIADLQGVFLNFKDESLIDGLSVSGTDISASEFAANSVVDLGNGVNLNGTQTTFDAGIKFGTSGIGSDDISNTTFTISHDTEQLSIEQFIDESFGVRLTSVGNNREDSSKLLGGTLASELLSQIGDRVWDDRNLNGIQDQGEVGVQGIKVTLLGGGADGLLSTTEDNIELETTTNSKGRYSFKNLQGDSEYQVIFSDLPEGYSFTDAGQGELDSRDSDANQVTGATETFSLAPGETNNKVDAGLVFTLTGPGKNEIKGTRGADVLYGTREDDDIRALGESDTVNGFEGNDCIYGHDGYDLLKGGSGADSIYGGRHDDTLMGESGNDILIGGFDNDDLIGGGGRDTLDGTNGSGIGEIDTLNGGAGADIFILGNETTIYYVGEGNNDYALIENFDGEQDTLQLNGSIGDYSTQRAGSDLELRTSNNELVAIFENLDSLDLSTTANFVG